jgi:hypothetical protein
VGREIVHYHDVIALEDRRQALLGIGKSWSIDRPDNIPSPGMRPKLNAGNVLETDHIKNLALPRLDSRRSLNLSDRYKPAPQPRAAQRAKPCLQPIEEQDAVRLIVTNLRTEDQFGLRQRTNRLHSRTTGVTTGDTTGDSLL